MISLVSLLRLGMVIVMVSQVPRVNCQLSSVLQTLQGSLGSFAGSLGGARSSLTGDASPTTGYPRGSRVGPFFLFRSSADNAAIVNEALRGMPIPRSTFLAIGDEFPKLRDDYIAKTRSLSPGTTQTTLQRALSVATNLQNWSLDRDNNRKELSDPFIRPSRQFVNSLRDRFFPNAPAFGAGGDSATGLKSPSPNRFKVSIDTVKTDADNNVVEKTE